MENSNLFNETGLLDQNGKLQINEAGKWAKFLGIVGFVMLAILLLFGLFARSLMSGLMSSAYGSGSPFSSLGGTFFTIYFIVICALWFYPTFMMYKFGITIRNAVKINDSARFNESLLYLKRFFKFLGILTVIVIAIYLLAFIFGGLGAMFAGSR